MQTATHVPALDLAPLLTDREVARVLRVSAGFLRNDRTRPNPRIPFVKIGGAVRYSPTAVTEFVRAGGTR